MQGIEQNQQPTAAPVAQQRSGNPALSYLNNVKERVPADAFNKSAISAQQMSQLQQLEQAYQGLTPEQQMQLQAAYQQQMQQSRGSHISILKPILFLALVGTLIFSSKARAIAMKPINKIKQLIAGRAKVSTTEGLTEYTKTLLEKAQKGIIQKADIKDVSLRLAGMNAQEKEGAFEIIRKLAKEYSNCESGVPSIVLKFGEGAQIPKTLKDGKVATEALEHLEDISLAFLNKGKELNRTNNIDISAIAREFKDNSSTGSGGKLWDFLKGLNS